MATIPKQTQGPAQRIGRSVRWVAVRIILSLALIYLVTEAEFQPIRAVYEAY